MAMKMIDPDLVIALEHASSELIIQVRKAIYDFYQDSASGWEQWEKWRTPKPWEERVLTNLERYHNDLQAARKAYDEGDIRPIVYEAAAYAGLSKDMEFDDNWMSEQNQIAVHQAVREVAVLASQIHRLGYALLTQA